MNKLISLVFSVVLVSSFASAGIVRYSARQLVRVSKPVVMPVAKIVTFPVRHPKKSEHGVRKASVVSAKVAGETGKVAGKILF